MIKSVARAPFDIGGRAEKMPSRCGGGILDPVFSLSRWTL